MKRKFMVLLTFLTLLSGCGQVEDDAQGNDVSAEPATSPESSTPKKETVAPQASPQHPTVTVPATETQSTLVETPTPREPTATPTEAAPTPVSPFSAESIEPGQHKAYYFLSNSGEEIMFWLYLPEAYDGSKTWPLIVSLHGFLGFEASLDRVREQSPTAYIGPDIEFPFIVISPQALSGSWALLHEPMEEIIELLGQSLSIDPDAQFLTGLSAGAVGAWQWALAFPTRFTGIASIAGAPSLNANDPILEDICLLKDLPIWIANSELDDRVPLEPVRDAVMALEECGSTVIHFTVYKDLKHAEAFRIPFAGPELYDWMLSLMDQDP